MKTLSKEVHPAAAQPIAALLPSNEDAGAIADRVLRELTSAELEEASIFPSFHH